MPTTVRTPLIDRQLIRQERLRRGLTLRQVAADIGIAANTLSHIENGENHANLTLAHLSKLADRFGLHPRELLLPPPDSHGASADDIKLEAALHELRLRRRRSTEIGTAFGWTRERFDAAAAQLMARLANTGVLLTRNEAGWMLAPRPAVLSDAERDRLYRIEEVRDELTLIQARMLKLAIRGQLTRAHLERNIGAEARTAIAYLLRHKFIEDDSDGGYRLTVPVAYSLRLIKSLPAGYRN